MWGRDSTVKGSDQGPLTVGMGIKACRTNPADMNNGMEPIEGILLSDFKSV